MSQVGDVVSLTMTAGREIRGEVTGGARKQQELRRLGCIYSLGLFRQCSSLNAIADTDESARV